LQIFNSQLYISIRVANEKLRAGLSIKEPETGRALSVAEVVVSRVGSELETAVEERSLEDHVSGSAAQESHVL
jgi:hypothetical protein